MPKHSQDEVLQIQTDSPKPLYQQVIDRIDQLIHEQQWPAGKKIPSENQLVQSLGVSRMTINRALRELTQQGLLQRAQGIGTFVAERPHHASLIELRNIAEEIRSEGHNYQGRVIDQSSDVLDKPLAINMEMSEGQQIFHIRMVHLRDELPIQLEDRYINPALVPDFMQQDFTRITPSEYLLSTTPADEIEHIVQATMPDLETTEHLSIAATEPCLQLLRRTWTANTVVSFATLVYPSSRYDLGARYKTQGRRPYSLLPGGFAARR